jgi:hypothetical protein
MFEFIKESLEIVMVLVMIAITVKAYKMFTHIQHRVHRLLNKYDRISELMDKNAHADVFLAKFSSKSKDIYHVRS